MLAIERKNEILAKLRTDQRVLVSELALHYNVTEETIRREPAYYLWTHNRWKRTHEEFNRRFEIANGKVVPKKEEDE